MAKSNRNAMLAKIHLAIKTLGMADEDYRGLLDAKFGVDSASRLTDEQLAILCTHFEKIGFESEKRVASGGAGKATQAQIHAIKKLWEGYARSGDWQSLETWLRRYWKCERVEWLDRQKASQVIAVLKKA